MNSYSATPATPPSARRFSWPLTRADILPLALAAGCAALWLILDPHSADRAAQVHRENLFQQYGYTLWNGNWFGGHHTLGYSLLFPPLAAVLGVQGVGVICALFSTVLFSRLATAHFGDQARFGVLLFAVGTCTDLFIGRLTFALGLTLGIAAALALQRERTKLATALAVLCTFGSPVAGLFLAMAGFTYFIAPRLRSKLAQRFDRVGAPEGSTELRWPGLWMAAGAFIPSAFLAFAFPEGGSQPFAWIGVLGLCGVLAITFVVLPSRETTLRIGVAIYFVAGVAAFVLPTPMGSNSGRIAASFAPALVACVMWKKSRGWVLALVLFPLLAYQWFGPVTEYAKTLDNQSTEWAYYAPLVKFLKERQKAEGPIRVQVVSTSTRWEAVYVAKRFPLARGWETQLDNKYQPQFYTDGVASGTYPAWLRETGASYVAVPDAAPDSTGVFEQEIYKHKVPYVHRVWSNQHWRVYKISDPRPLIEGPATLTRLSPTSFSLTAHEARLALVRVRFSPYWQIVRGEGCVKKGPDDWTFVYPTKPGPMRIETRFNVTRIVDRGPICTDGSELPEQLGPKNPNGPEPRNAS